MTVWGRATRRRRRRSRSAAARAWGWDEAEVPFFEYSERSTGQSKKYFDAMSAERGTPVKPKLSFGWLALRTTRLPFLSATIVPVVLGIAIAARQGSFDLLTAVLTVIGAAFVQLGLNVANDVFDSDPGRRRRERHADPVQRRLAGHPVRPRVAPPDGRAGDDLLRRWPA